jgi:GTP cyclohydrolase I
MNTDILEKYLSMGESHASGSAETPLRSDAFDLSNEEKIAKIESHFREIMHTLGLDLTDDSLSGTPYRVAKMYVEEIFSGLDPANLPKVALFENRYGYNQMLVEKDITLYSNCEHHFVPIVGKVHVAYLSNGHVLGLSKIHRIVRHFARRPQVQERLTIQIADYLMKVLNTEHVAVIVDAEHLCVSSRGIEDHTSSTITSSFKGKFLEESVKNEFLRYLTLS